MRELQGCREDARDEIVALAGARVTRWANHTNAVYDNRHSAHARRLAQAFGNRFA